jgi:hypothetical protein
MSVPFVSDIEPDFRKQLLKLVPMILAPENLVIKEIAGQKVKAKELLQYFKSYLEIYRGDKLPEPKSMLVVSVSCLLCFSLMFMCCSDLNIRGGTQK